MNQITVFLTLGAIVATAFAHIHDGSAYHRTDEKRDFYRALLESIIYALIKIGDEKVPPHYAYEYSVHDPKTGDMKSQAEQRQGDVVKGYYTLKEADGTLRQVHYSADKDRGFQAAVKRFGYSHHPHYSHHGFFNYVK